MKERPILFSGPMVRAILAGRKTMTRRVIKPQPYYNRAGFLSWKTSGCLQNFERSAETMLARHCPYGVPGDRLWVRETFGTEWRSMRPTNGDTIYYAADGDAKMVERWRPSIHMPRWASRITLEITGVRVERLKDISEQDAVAEGVQGLEKMMAGGTDTRDPDSGVEHALISNPITCFSFLWESINGRESWDANPWVWVVEWERRMKRD